MNLRSGRTVFRGAAAAMLMLLVLMVQRAPAQVEFGPPAPEVLAAEGPEGPSIPEGFNSVRAEEGLRAAGEERAPSAAMDPISLLDSAARATPGFEGGLSGAISVVIVLTVIALVPTLMIMCTCFVRFVIVLGLLKQALGTQTLPPSQVILALSLFMTMLVMAPTFERVYDEALAPYQAGVVRDPAQLWGRAKQPIRDFMFAQIDAAQNWSSVYMVMNQRGIDTSNPGSLKRSDVDMLTLIPAYMLSELKVAFLLGFRVYLPFLVIDMVISCLLISMSMMMLPPVLISLPFKILLFVMVDGWQLLVGSLMQSVSKAGAM